MTFPQIFQISMALNICDSGLKCIWTQNSVKIVLESVKIISKKNICIFNNEFYRQIGKTIMGLIFTQTQKVLTIAYFEVYFYNICELNWEGEFQEFFLENWSRFLYSYKRKN